MDRKLAVNVLDMGLYGSYRQAKCTGNFCIRAATRNELDATQLRLKQAALALERLKVRFALYKKAGEGTAGDAQTKTWTSGKPLPSTMSSGF